MTNEQNGMEKLATELESTGNYKVLRKLNVKKYLGEYKADDKTRLGMFLDLETTGLDASKCEIIEFGIVPFVYTIDGEILGTLEPFSALREPSHPIPEEVVELTGITNEMVKGKTVSPEEVAHFVAPASLIIAHNANFDRKFAEKFSEVFVTKPWACSMQDVDWAKAGFEGRKLGYLGMEAGFFFNGHRAVDDCDAGVEILNFVLPSTGKPAMVSLLENARCNYCRVWAKGAPFDLKDELRKNGYRWNDGTDGNPKSWYKEIPEAEVKAELSFLEAEIFSRSVDHLPVTKITPYDRFSNRC